jgi:hypothetical protein
MFEKFDWRYWAAIGGIGLWVAIRDAERGPIYKRIIKIISSGLIAYGAGGEVAPYVGNNEIVAAIILMTFGHIALDVATTMLSDPETKVWIRRILVRKLGGGEEK